MARRGTLTPAIVVRIHAPQQSVSVCSESVDLLNDENSSNIDVGSEVYTPQHYDQLLSETPKSNEA